MKSVYTVTKSALSGYELLSIWEDESSAIKEAKSLAPALKDSEEIHVAQWVTGERVCRHVQAYNDSYDPSDEDEDEDTPVMPPT